MPFGLVLLDLLTRKIKKRCIKGTLLGTLPLWNGKDPDPRIQQSNPDPYHIEKQVKDPDWYKSYKQDPYPYQKGLDPQHWA